MIPIPGEGWLKGVEGIDAAKAVPLIQDVSITVHVNQRIVPLPEGASYLGFIFANGPAPVEVEQALRDAHACLRFRIEAGLPIISASLAFRTQ